MSIEYCLASVGPGWGPLVVSLYSDLLAMGWDGDVHQVKEKFGGLRFYIGRGSPEIWDRIDEAEAMSFKICEDCGQPGQPRPTGWIKTRCDGCYGDA